MQKERLELELREKENVINSQNDALASLRAAAATHAAALVAARAVRPCDLFLFFGEGGGVGVDCVL